MLYPDISMEFAVNRISFSVTKDTGMGLTNFESELYSSEINAMSDSGAHIFDKASSVNSGDRLIRSFILISRRRRARISPTSDFRLPV